MALAQWDDEITTQLLTFNSSGSQALTIPAGATGVMLSSLDEAGVEFWVSPSTADPSGIRVGGVSPRPVLFRLGPSAVMRVHSATGTGETFCATYFYNQPAGGGNVDAVDLPVWDGRILRRNYAMAILSTSQVFLPSGSGWFSLAVLERTGPREVFLELVSGGGLGIKFGGPTGIPFIQRYTSEVKATGAATSDDAGGDDLIDVNADFLAARVVIGDIINNATRNLFAPVTAIDSATQLSHTVLVAGFNPAGASLEWGRGDAYVVYRGPKLFIHNVDGSLQNDVHLLVYQG